MVSPSSADGAHDLHLITMVKMQSSRCLHGREEQPLILFRQFSDTVNGPDEYV